MIGTMVRSVISAVWKSTPVPALSFLFFQSFAPYFLFDPDSYSTVLHGETLPLFVDCSPFLASHKPG
jgi:hypothetical protein